MVAAMMLKNVSKKSILSILEISRSRWSHK
jgi:hypothetical protein